MTKKELTPVHLSNVTIDGPFWARQMKINRERTIPYEYKVFKDTGRIDSLKPGWKPSTDYDPRYFGYGGIYSWIEAASYSITTHPDAQREALIDELVDMIARRQEPDGYMPGSYKDIEPEKRWTNLRDRSGGYLITLTKRDGLTYLGSTHDISFNSCQS